MALCALLQLAVYVLWYVELLYCIGVIYRCRCRRCTTVHQQQQQQFSLQPVALHIVAGGNEVANGSAAARAQSSKYVRRVHEKSDGYGTHGKI